MKSWHEGKILNFPNMQQTTPPPMTYTESTTTSTIETAYTEVATLPRWLSRLFQPIVSRLFYKMLIIYSLLTLIPLIVVSTTFYVRASHLIGKKAMEDVQQSLNKAAIAIDAPLFAIKKRMIDIGDDERIQSYLKLANAASTDNGMLEHERTLLLQVQDQLQIELDEEKQKIGPFVEDIHLVSLSAKSASADGDSALKYPAAYGLLPFEFNRMPEWAFFTDARRMACDMNVYESGTDLVLGHLVVTLEPSGLQNRLVDFPANTFFVTSSDNVILSATDEKQIGSVLDVRGPERQLLIEQKSQYADFRFVHLAAPGAGSVLEKQAIFSAAITLIAWAMVFLATYVILKRVTTPIQMLTRRMRRAEQEEYQLVKLPNSQDEVAMLCRGYNRLVARTKDLIDTNYKNELLIREAELRAIRMYINPHFLYNTLEYISILSQNPAKTIHVPDIVQKLSSIFRFSISPENTFVSLETELSFVEKYLAIHRYRFGDRLRFEIVLPEMLRNAAVPKLILQPLVENAFIHGFDRLPDGGRIEIAVREEYYELVIEIRNPVPSLPPQASPAAAGRMGLGSGFDNVNARIRHHFGNEYGAVLVRGEETAIVTVRLPVQLYVAPITVEPITEEGLAHANRSR